MTRYRSKDIVEAMQYNGPEDLAKVRAFCANTLLADGWGGNVISKIRITSAGNLKIPPHGLVSAKEFAPPVIERGDYVVKGHFPGDVWGMFGLAFENNYEALPDEPAPDNVVSLRK